MEFRGTGPIEEAKRRAYAHIADACGGDTEMADELVEWFAEDTPPSLADLRMVAAHAREVAADIEAERTEAVRKVKMRLVGEDGNAFAILGRLQRAAKASGWTREEIKAVTDDAASGDYDHLLAVMMEYVDEPEDD